MATTSLLLAHLGPIITETINQTVQNILDHSPDVTTFDSFVLSDRLKARIAGDVTRAVCSMGLRKSLTLDPTYHIPYMEILERMAPTLPERIKSGEIDLIGLANSNEIAFRTLPFSALQDLFDLQNTSNMIIPYNRILPYSMKALNAAYLGVAQSKLIGDDARGMPMADFWRATCTPETPGDRDNGFVSENARFSLITVLLTLRKNATLPRAKDLSESFYYEHPENTMGISTERFSMSGPAFLGAKRIAEIWNNLIHTLHGNPADGTAGHANIQRLIFGVDDVAAALAAISLVIRCYPEDAIIQSEFFYVNRARFSQKQGESVDLATQLLKVNSSQSTMHQNDTSKQPDKSCPSKDVLTVGSGAQAVWGQPHERLNTSTQYNNSRCLPRIHSAQKSWNPVYKGRIRKPSFRAR